MTKRLLILFLFIGGFFSLLFFLPKAPTMKPSRLARELPLTFGSWSGSPSEPGIREKKILAKDTEFERMRYEHKSGVIVPRFVFVLRAGLL